MASRTRKRLTRADVAARSTQELPHDVVPVGDGEVEVRALTRAEALSLPDDHADQEAHILALGLVDPSLSVSEVKAWLKGSPAGELQDVVKRISNLSGMHHDAAKESYKSVRDESDAGV